MLGDLLPLLTAEQLGRRCLLPNVTEKLQDAALAWLVGLWLERVVSLLQTLIW